MRLALLGDSPAFGNTLRAVVSYREHELVAAALAPRHYAALKSAVPTLRHCARWEELLLIDDLDAVIVAGHDEATLAAGRQIAAAGKALLAAPVAGLDATFAYELTLLQTDQPTCLVPLFGDRAHPLVDELRTALAGGALGEVRHVRLERRLRPAEPLSSGDMLCDADIATAFLPDADLLRSVWGEYDQVTAIRSGDPSSGVSLLTVTLGGPGVPQTVWSATAAANEPLWCLQIAGSRGTVTLSGSGTDAPLQLETAIGGRIVTSEAISFDGAGWLLSELVWNLDSKGRHGAENGSASPDCPTWEDFVHAVELYEAIERSIKRRRTIDLHFETPSERGQFKTQMSAVGCSILILTLGAFVVLVVAETMFPLAPQLKRGLLLLTFLPLTLFLALQVLYFLARPSKRAEPEGPVD